MQPVRVSLKSPHSRSLYPPTLISLPKADLFISTPNKIIPCHRNKLQQIPKIAQIPTSSHLLILPPLNPQPLIQIIHYYYGIDMELGDIDQLREMLEILLYLEIWTIRDRIQQLLVQRVREFDTFGVIGVAGDLGLARVVQECFSYLEMEQYQQFKYYQYSLFNCSFRLFQLLLRRHHRLKAQHKICGNSVEFIEELIQTYCRRNQIPAHIKSQLLLNYTYQPHPQSQPNSYPQSSPQSPQLPKIKNSLRLHKLSYKNIGQSITLYGNDSEKRSKQSQLSLNTGNSSNTVNIRILEPKLSQYQRPASPVRVRKYSMEIDKMLGEMGFNRNFGKKNVQSSMEMEIQSTIPEEDQCLFDDIVLSSQNIHTMGKKQQQKQLRRIKTLQNQKLELFQHQISQIGNNGSLQLKLHQIQDIERHTLRPNTKSMIFPEVIEEEIEESMEQKIKKNTKRQSGAARGSYIV